jgi:hypothetical protein
VGCCHGNPKCRHYASGRRPRARICLRKGCGCRYQPRCWNQRYCQEPECRRQVLRWQAAQRQARRRLSPETKAQHAEAQRARRQRAQAALQRPKDSEVVAARGHAADFFSTFFCDRPGCYEPPQKSVRNPACYCSRTCGEAVRRVLDRERKWQSRGTLQGRCKRASEYQAARARRCRQRHDASSTPSPRASSP